MKRKAYTQVWSSIRTFNALYSCLQGTYVVIRRHGDFERRAGQRFDGERNGRIVQLVVVTI